MSARVIKFQCDSGFYSNVHQDSEEKLQPCTPSYLYLWLGNVLLAAFASVFFISNQLQLRWVVVTLPASAILVAVAVVIWGSCSHQKASVWSSEDLRQSLLEEDSGSKQEMPADHERNRNTLVELVDSDRVRSSIEDPGQVRSGDGVDSDDDAMAGARRCMRAGAPGGSASGNITEWESTHAHGPVV